jgi:hypothetical protein
VLVDPEVGISTITSPLARRWWREVGVDERMQGVLATQFEGVSYSVPHCDFVVAVEDQKLVDDEVEVAAGNNWIKLPVCYLMPSDSRSVRVVTVSGHDSV